MNDFKIPAGVLAQHTAVLGKTGSGKTSTAKLMIEQVVADGSRVCILDPIKSDWWGLTSSKDGKRAGLPFVILGGPHGHVPLHSSAGKAIGDVVASGSLPLSIIDMADFEAGGLQRFFVDFAETIFKRNRGVLYLVVEEAHEFAPKERSGIGAENMSIHWAKKLATGTRTKGIRLIVATQRTQALHNAMIGSCDTVIAHRMTAPADQEPVVKWMRANAGKDASIQVADSLSNIRTGSGWLASGEAKLFELVQFPRIKTYDNTATPTGDSLVDAVKTAPVDADKLRSIIGDAVKTAEANDPVILKKKIAEMERLTINAAKSIPADATALDRARKQGHDEATQKYYDAWSGLCKTINDEILKMRQAHASLGEAIDVIGLRFQPETLYDGMANKLAKATKLDDYTHPNVLESDKRAPRVAPKSGNGHAVDPRVSRPQQVILDQLMVLQQRGIYPASRATLAAFCEVSPSSSGFEKNLSTLKTGGFIEYPRPGEVAFTDQGDAAANPPNDDGRPAFDFWVDIVNGPKQEILRALITEHPKAMSRGAIAQAARVSATSSGFEKNLSQLKTLGAIEYPMQGVVALSRYVMP